MKKTLAIIGGGSAALMLACEIDTTKYEVTLFEKNPTLGRKFLVAGNGGFNLTHSEEMEDLKSRYIANETILKSLDSFTNTNLIDWLSELGIETYVGSSKRIFPKKNTKPIHVLNKIKQKIEENNVIIKTNHTWKGFSESNELIIENNEGEFTEKFDKVVFALGGKSWSKTGSDGSWAPFFEEKGIKIVDFLPSNCHYEITWKEKFAKKHQGEPLKNIRLTCGDNSKKGEVVVTRYGMEGGAIYALSPQIREYLLKEEGSAPITLDLKPTVKIDSMIRKLKNPRKRKSWSDHVIWQLKLSPVTFALLKRSMDKEDFNDLETLANRVKCIPLSVVNFGPIDEAISTVGGVSLDEINENFELKNLPNHYAIGEMLDWDAPTGGYLLQGCFSMGKFLAGVV